MPMERLSRGPVQIRPAKVAKHVVPRGREAQGSSDGDGKGGRSRPGIFESDPLLADDGNARGSKRDGRHHVGG